MKKLQLALTFSQCKTIVENGQDLRSSVDQLNDQPDWLLEMGGITSIYELKSIIECGCASGAFMPAVTYYTANKIMSQYGDDILEFLDNTGSCDVIAIDPSFDSWSGIAVKFVSMAVELWCIQFDSVVDGMDY